MRAPSKFPARGVACATLVLLAAVGVAHAHGVRLPFADWGGFAPDVARCQRAIARAGARCASHSWALRQACRASLLAGRPCDEAKTAAAIAAVRRRTLDGVDAACTERQAIALQFLSIGFDLQSDLVDFCRESVDAVESGVFGPALGGTSLSAAERTCVAATADAATQVMSFALRSRRGCMDQLAVIDRATPNREGEIAHADAHLGRAVARTSARLAARCGGAFEPLYGRAPAELLAVLGQRADCVGSRFYIQDRVLCPAPVCGNGVVEPGEACDDGNATSGDRCAADCLQ